MSQDKVETRLQMLDQRLDNLDSIVTTLVERVMKQPVSMEVTCPKCGNVVQITFTSNTRKTDKSHSH